MSTMEQKADDQIEAGIIAKEDLMIKQKAVIEYCYENLQYMWAAKITGMLLGCDFKNAKEHAEIFFEHCESEGI